MPTILIVDDEQDMRNLVEIILTKEGFQTIQAQNAEEALAQLAKHKVNLILMDVMMPGRDGFSVGEEIRQTSKVPMIFLTARDANEDKVKGLMLGADDYIVKPFSASELVARITAVLRRSGSAIAETENKRIVRGCIQLDEVSRKVMVHEHVLELTLKEYELMYLFMNSPNVVFSREQILDSIWNGEYEGSMRTVDTHIKTLRLKLAQFDQKASEAIQTVWGIGYRFEAPK